MHTQTQPCAFDKKHMQVWVRVYKGPHKHTLTDAPNQ